MDYVIDFTHSGEIGELVKAVIAAKKKMGTLVKDATNPHFRSKYADLASLIDVTEPLLDEGVMPMQFPGNYCKERSSIALTTLLAHTSGQWIRARMEIPMVKPTPQDAGSGITYARRYALGACLNIAAKDEDDDGETAMARKPAVTNKSQPGDMDEPAWFKTEPAAPPKDTGPVELHTPEVRESQYRLFEEKLSLVGTLEDLVSWWGVVLKAKKAGHLSREQVANLTKLKDAHKKAFEEEASREPGSDDE